MSNSSKNEHANKCDPSSPGYIILEIGNKCEPIYVKTKLGLSVSVLEETALSLIGLEGGIITPPLDPNIDFLYDIIDSLLGEGFVTPGFVYTTIQSAILKTLTVRIPGLKTFVVVVFGNYKITLCINWPLITSGVL